MLDDFVDKINIEQADQAVKGKNKIRIIRQRPKNFKELVKIRRLPHHRLMHIHIPRIKRWIRNQRKLRNNRRPTNPVEAGET